MNISWEVLQDDQSRFERFRTSKIKTIEEFRIHGIVCGAKNTKYWFHPASPLGILSIPMNRIINNTDANSYQESFCVVGPCSESVIICKYRYGHFVFP